LKGKTILLKKGIFFMLGLMFNKIKIIFPFITETTFVWFFLFVALQLNARENTRSIAIEDAYSELDTRGEIYFSIPVDGVDLEQLTRVVSIHRVQLDSVYVFSGKKGFAEFLKMDLPFHLKKVQPPSMSKKRKYDVPGFFYPTYQEYIQLMESYANNFPGICSLIEAGTSVLNRKILFLKITRGPGIQETEPAFMYSASIHGNETAGYPLMIKLIDSLLNGYDENARVKDLVDNMEIWINPLANPDGMYNSGNNSVLLGTRFNANNVDLNRNFPDPVRGDHPDGNAWQPETEAMMDIMKANNFVLSVNFHSGAEVVNYPWDSFSSLHPDNEWFVQISRQYVDTVHQYSPVYFNDPAFNDGIINGYEWYPVHGGRQDYMTYFMHGREVTIEISDEFYTPEEELPQLWNYNKRSFFGLFKQATCGIHGMVIDSVTGDPLYAKISIQGHDRNNSFVYTGKDVGDFHRLVLPGMYNLEISADGYATKIVDVIVDESIKRADLEIKMVKDDTGVARLSEENHILYPNPVKEQLTIHLPGNDGSSARVKILDLNGRVFHEKIYPGYLNPVVINTSYFNEGIYILKMVKGKSTFTRKIIVDKD
jgi:hypothetical protein